MKYEDQGLGVLFSHLAVAEEMLRQDGKKINEKNMFLAIQDLAADKAESYTPNHELGANPGVQMSPKLEKNVSPQVFDETYLEARFPNQAKRKQLQAKMKGAVTNLTNIFLEDYYQIKRRGEKKNNKYKSDPNKASKTEKIDGGLVSKDEKDRHNREAVIFQHLRYFIKTYIYDSLIPLMIETEDSVRSALSDMEYKNLDTKVLNGNTAADNASTALHETLLPIFAKNMRFANLLRQYRWMPDGRLVKKKQKAETKTVSPSRLKKPKS